uniref:Uncharacterized protein n=1 Tax=Ditylenchus dipsaci TaxID=166011 RepID=A0A915DVW5_9BILA
MAIWKKVVVVSKPTSSRAMAETCLLVFVQHQHEEAVREVEQVRHTNETLQQENPSSTYRAQTEASNIRIVTPNYKTGEKPSSDFKTGVDVADLNAKFSETNGDYKAERSQEHFRMQIIDPKVNSNAHLPAHAPREYARKKLMEDFPSLHGKRSFLNLDSMEQRRVRQQSRPPITTSLYLTESVDRHRDMQASELAKYLKAREEEANKPWNKPGWPGPRTTTWIWTNFDRVLMPSKRTWINTFKSSMCRTKSLGDLRAADPPDELLLWQGRAAAINNTQQQQQDKFDQQTIPNEGREEQQLGDPGYLVKIRKNKYLSKAARSHSTVCCCKPQGNCQRLQLIQRTRSESELQHKPVFHPKKLFVCEQVKEHFVQQTTLTSERQLSPAVANNSPTLCGITAHSNVTPQHIHHQQPPAVRPRRPPRFSTTKPLFGGWMAVDHKIGQLCCPHASKKADPDNHSTQELLQSFFVRSTRPTTSASVHLDNQQSHEATAVSVSDSAEDCSSPPPASNTSFSTSINIDEQDRISESTSSVSTQPGFHHKTVVPVNQQESLSVSPIYVKVFDGPMREQRKRQEYYTEEEEYDDDYYINTDTPHRQQAQASVQQNPPFVVRKTHQKKPTSFQSTTLFHSPVGHSLGQHIYVNTSQDNTSTDIPTVSLPGTRPGMTSPAEQPVHAHTSQIPPPPPPPPKSILKQNYEYKQEFVDGAQYWQESAEFANGRESTSTQTKNGGDTTTTATNTTGSPFNGPSFAWKKLKELGVVLQNSKYQEESMPPRSSSSVEQSSSHPDLSRTEELDDEGVVVICHPGLQ